LANILMEGRERGELAAAFAPIEIAATIVAVLQGGYALACAANSAASFESAIEGILNLRGAHTKTIAR
jgi:TetR/AcrR family transcriptional regulator, transcriptional repressor for nem operon